MKTSVVHCVSAELLLLNLPTEKGSVKLWDSMDLKLEMVQAG